MKNNCLMANIVSVLKSVFKITRVIWDIIAENMNMYKTDDKDRKIKNFQNYYDLTDNEHEPVLKYIHIYKFCSILFSCLTFRGWIMGTSIIYAGQVIVTVEYTKFASLIEPTQEQEWLCVNAWLREKLDGAFAREALDRRSHVCSLYVYVCVCIC